MSLFFISPQEADQTRADAYSAPPPPPPPHVPDIWHGPGPVGQAVGSLIEGVRTFDPVEGIIAPAARAEASMLAAGADFGAAVSNLPNTALRDNIDFPNAPPAPQTDIAKWFEEQRNAVLARRAEIMPTRQMAQSTQIVAGVTETLLPAVVAGPAGLPGVAAALGGSTFESRRQDLQAQGVDSATASDVAIEDAATMASMAGVPMAGGASRWMRALTSAASNVALGAGMRYNTAQTLRDRGYGPGSDNDLASQYQWVDVHQMGIDAIIGAAFGAIAPGHGNDARPPERVVQAAIDAQDNINRQTAFGIAVNDESARWQSETISRMGEQAANDQPIDPGPAPEGVDFVERPPSTVADERGTIIARVQTAPGDIPQNPEIPLDQIQVAYPNEEAAQVSARPATEDQVIRTSWAELQARAGRDMIVGEAQNDPRPVRQDIFRATYREVAPGQYVKRSDVPVGYWIADRDMTIHTLEGDVEAHAGDHVLIGAAGEMWPVRAEKFAQRYHAPDRPIDPLHAALAEELQAQGLDPREIEARMAELYPDLPAENAWQMHQRNLPPEMLASVGQHANRVEHITDEPNGEQTFLERLPKEGEKWRAAQDLAREHLSPEAAAWINYSPSRAQAVVMATARKADGSFRYSEDEILNATGMASNNSLRATLSKARKAGIPVPSRQQGGASGATKPAFFNMRRVIEMLEKDPAMGSRAMASRLGIDHLTIDKLLADARRGRSLYGTEVPPDLAARARAIPRRQSAGKFGKFYSVNPDGGFSTPEDFRAAVSGFGVDSNVLERAGKVEIVNTASALPFSVPDNVTAVNWRGKSYFIADRIGAWEAVSKMLHETGVHEEFEGFLGKAGVREVRRQLMDMWANGHPLVSEAMKFALENAGPSRLPEEGAAYVVERAQRAQEALKRGSLSDLTERERASATAYLLENARELPVVSQILSAFRQWLIRKFGTTLGMRLTVEDIRQLAITALHGAEIKARRAEAADAAMPIPALSPAFSRNGDTPDAGPVAGEQLTPEEIAIHAKFDAELEANSDRHGERDAALDAARDAKIEAVTEQLDAQRDKANEEAEKAAEADLARAEEAAQSEYDKAVEDDDSDATEQRAFAAYEKAVEKAEAARDKAVEKAEERNEAAYEKALERAETEAEAELEKKGLENFATWEADDAATEQRREQALDAEFGSELSQGPIDEPKFSRSKKGHDGGAWHDEHLWHGSHEASGPIQQFSFERIGRTGAGTGEKAIFLSGSETMANAYGPAHSYQVRGRILDYDANGASYKHFDGQQRPTIASILERAKRDGYDGVRFRNMWDHHQYNGHPPTDRLAGHRFADQVAVFDPANIRPSPAAPARGASAGGQTFYHGTNANISDAAQIAPSDANNTLGPGRYVWRDRQRAQRWGANVIPVQSDGPIASPAQWRAALQEARRSDPAAGETLAQEALKRQGFVGADGGNDGVVLFENGPGQFTDEAIRGVDPHSRQLARADGAGSIIYNAGRARWRVRDVTLDNNLRGRGNGVALYEELIRRARAAGVPEIISDTEMRPGAYNVYKALERRGYQVEWAQGVHMPQGTDNYVAGAAHVPIARIRTTEATPARGGVSERYRDLPPAAGDREGWRTLEISDGSGALGYRHDGDTWRVGASEISEEARGQGNGTRLYEELIARARASGARYVESGSTVSTDAQRVYAALERRGYAVERLPQGRFRVDTGTPPQSYARGAGSPEQAPTQSVAAPTMPLPEVRDIRPAASSTSWARHYEIPIEGDYQVNIVMGRLPREQFRDLPLGENSPLWRLVPSEREVHWSLDGKPKIVDPQERARVGMRAIAAVQRAMEADAQRFGTTRFVFRGATRRQDALYRALGERARSMGYDLEELHDFRNSFALVKRRTQAPPNGGDFPLLSVGQNRADPVESRGFQSKLRAVEERLANDGILRKGALGGEVTARAGSVGESRINQPGEGQGVSERARRGRGNAEASAEPVKIPRGVVSDILSVSGLRLEKDGNSYGRYRASIDTPQELDPTIANAIGPEDASEPTHIRFDLVESGPSKRLLIRLSSNHPSVRNTGAGKWLYRQLIDWGLEHGYEVSSDFSVSPQAQRVYQAFERMGYQVERSPHATEKHNGTLSTKDLTPVYRVRGGDTAEILDAAPAPRGGYEIDGPTLAERMQPLIEARQRQEAYAKLSPAEQALQDNPDGVTFSVGRRDVSGRDMLARTEQEKAQAADMRKGFEAAAKCAARNAGTQVFRALPTAASFVSLRATAAGALPSADAAIGQILGLGAAIPLGVTAAPALLNASRRVSAPGSYIDQLEQSTLPLSQQRVPQGSNDQRFPAVANPSETLPGEPTPDELRAVAQSYGASAADANKYAQGSVPTSAPPTVNHGPPDEQTGILPGPNVDVHVAPASNPNPEPADNGEEGARLLRQFLESGGRKQ